MTPVERFEKTARFQPVDRLPLIEWSPWPEATLSRWYAEGLPRGAGDPWEARRDLGLDSHRPLRIFARGATCPPSPLNGFGLVSVAEDYHALKGHLYPRPRPWTYPGQPDLPLWSREHEQGESVVSLTFDGFFWYPRTLLGADRHFYAFYDDPALVHSMNRDLADYMLWAIEDVCREVRPDFAVLIEDLSHDRGPVLSPQLFEEFLAPYYRRVIPAFEQKGILPFVACDGDVDVVAGWFRALGVRGLAPLERRAGADPVALRAAHPDLLLMGGIDCGLLGRSPDLAAVDDDLGRLLPLARSGGFFPGLDCPAPRDLPLDKYRAYIALLTEYCARAGATEPSAAARPTSC